MQRVPTLRFCHWLKRYKSYTRLCSRTHQMSVSTVVTIGKGNRQRNTHVHLIDTCWLLNNILYFENTIVTPFLPL